MEENLSWKKIDNHKNDLEKALISIFNSLLLVIEEEKKLTVGKIEKVKKLMENQEK